MSERPIFHAQGMTVVHMSQAEKDEAQRRFDALVAEKTAAGAITEHNFGAMYEALWAATHHGAEAVEVVPDEQLAAELAAHNAAGGAVPTEAHPGY